MKPDQITQAPPLFRETPFDSAVLAITLTRLHYTPGVSETARIQLQKRESAEQ